MSLLHICTISGVLYFFLNFSRSFSMFRNAVFIFHTHTHTHKLHTHTFFYFTATWTHKGCCLGPRCDFAYRYSPVWFIQYFLPSPFFPTSRLTFFVCIIFFFPLCHIICSVEITSPLLTVPLPLAGLCVFVFFSVWPLVANGRALTALTPG